MLFKVYFKFSTKTTIVISSDRSSYSDDVLVYIQLGGNPLFENLAFIPFYNVTSVTRSRLYSINAIEV